MEPTQDSRLKRWLLQGYLKEPVGPYDTERSAHQTHPWYKVMCLTGVDYFSTLGYQPGIAALAAGVLAPGATLILVLVTLFGALPVYRYVAHESPHGDGSISMLETLLSWWKGKLFVLALLGFVATDFVITMTLSAADATAHILENPLAPRWLEGNEVGVTLCLLAFLSVVFLKGFKEAVGVAVGLVTTYLTLNAIVVVRGLQQLQDNPVEIGQWWDRVMHSHGGSPAGIALATVIVFPSLALGLSGFETGVVVMPLVKGKPGESEKNPEGRIKNTRRLLATAAVVMSTFLLGTSIVTTAHIPPEAFRAAAEGIPKGEANGRALAYLAHEFFGPTFGTIYDISTITILWFAGASAMAGLLNIVPRFLPRYGMAPEWARAIRPLVLIYTLIAFFVTIIFKADVVAQGGAYATGVLVLITSAAFAVTLSVRRRGLRGATWRFGIITAVFVFTTIVNVVERPDGLKIACFFIFAIVLLSFISRIWRTLELRVDRVDLDLVAKEFVLQAAGGDHLIRIIPNRPEERGVEEYDRQIRETRQEHQIPESEEVIFFEVEVRDASNFSSVLKVRGLEVGGHKVLRTEAAAVPNSIAAFLLHVQNITGKRPHAYFNWSEGSPLEFAVKYLFAGRGDVAPLTREILRKVSKDPEKRPVVHAA